MSSPDNFDPDDPRREEERDVITRRRVKRPPLYRVIFHNDDYTTRDFVVMVLMRYFHKDNAAATQIMLQVHHNGQGIAGVYPYDIARSKIGQVEALARQQEMPLRLSLEPEDTSSDEGE